MEGSSLTSSSLPLVMNWSYRNSGSDCLQEKSNDDIYDSVEIMESGSVGDVTLNSDESSLTIIDDRPSKKRRKGLPAFADFLKSNKVVAGQALYMAYEHGKYIYYGKIEADGSMSYCDSDGSTINFHRPCGLVDHISKLRNRMAILVPKRNSTVTPAITYGEYKKQRRVKRGGKSDADIRHDGWNKIKVVFKNKSSNSWVMVYMSQLKSTASHIRYDQLMPVMYDDIMLSMHIQNWQPPLFESMETTEAVSYHECAPIFQNVDDEMSGLHATLSEMGDDNEKKIEYLIKQAANNSAIIRALISRDAEIDSTIITHSQQACTYATQEMNYMDTSHYPPPPPIELPEFSHDASTTSCNPSAEKEQPQNTAKFKSFKIKRQLKATEKSSLNVVGSKRRLVVHYGIDITEEIL